MLRIRMPLVCAMLFLLSGLPSRMQAAQEPDHVIPLRQTVVDGSKIKHKPGDVIGIEAGKRETLKIINVKGTAKKPIVIVNHKGVVEVSNKNRGYAIAIQGCAWVRFTGTGEKKTPYGFRCATERKGMMALHVNGKSTCIEVDHVEVFGAGFAGFNVKDEPSLDGSTNRGTFVMRNISLHDNYIHDVQGEGFYIGHTFFEGYKHKSGKVLMPHVIEGLRVYNNILRNTGCEGIQIGSAVADVEVFCNLVDTTGVSPFMKWQDNGVQIGMGTTGTFYNNIIKNVPANGIVLWGTGDNQVYNNLILNTGGYGVYIHGQPGTGYRFAHNTIIDAKKGGIRVGPDKTDAYIMQNNLLILPEGAPFLQAPKGKLTDEGNVTLHTLDEAKLRGTKAGDYRPTSKSPARKAGSTIKDISIDVDLAGAKRPSKKADAGAYQYPGKKPAPVQLDTCPPLLPVTPWAKE